MGRSSTRTPNKEAAQDGIRPRPSSGMSRLQPSRLVLRGPLGSPTGPHGSACSSAPPLPTARVGREQRPRRPAPPPAPPVPGGRSRAAGLAAAPSGPDRSRRVLTARLATARAAEAPGQPLARVFSGPGGAEPAGAAAASERLSPAPPRPMRGRGRPLKVNGRGPGACALGAAEELGWVGRASRGGGRGSEREGRGLGRRRGRGVGRAARDARGSWRRLGPTAYYWRPRPRALARATRSLPLLPHRFLAPAGR